MEQTNLLCRNIHNNFVRTGSKCEFHGGTPLLNLILLAISKNLAPVIYDVKMFGVACPQCNKASNGAANRLVRDSCGHEKCRVCLLLDEEKCQQCKNEKDHEQQSVIKFENHTGVITCNGTAKKSEICPVVQNGAVEKKCDDMKPPPIVQKVKSKCSKSRNVKGSQSKRVYRSITIPNHVTILKDPTRYKCTICDKQFSTKSHIKYHIYCTGRKLFCWWDTITF